VNVYNCCRVVGNVFLLQVVRKHGLYPNALYPRIDRQYVYFLLQAVNYFGLLSILKGPVLADAGTAWQRPGGAGAAVGSALRRPV
jgi:hypothetical protein